jgi:hypothetical protein
MASKYGQAGLIVDKNIRITMMQTDPKSDI